MQIRLHKYGTIFFFPINSCRKEIYIFFLFSFDSHEVIMPFIPIGLKETVDINFWDTFSERVCVNLIDRLTFMIKLIKKRKEKKICRILIVLF